MATQEKLKDLFGIDVPDDKVITVNRKPGEEVSYNPYYHFNLAVVQKLLAWTSPKRPNRNMFISGDGGIGKTSLFIEYAARLGIPLSAKSCSGRTRFEELVGTLVIAKDGSTQWVDGPLTERYRNGGIFLANEITRMDSGEQMLLVDVLDERSNLVIPQTGEVLTAHETFRFAGTGNSVGFGDDVGAYAGEKKGSSAFLDRFWKIELPKLSEDEEFKIVMASATRLPDNLARNMIKLARETRKLFIGNAGNDSQEPMRVCIETRALVAWAKLFDTYAVIKSIPTPLEEALKDSVLNGCPDAEKAAISDMYKVIFGVK